MTKVVIFAGIVAIIVGGYFFFVGGNEETESPVEGQSESTSQEVGEQSTEITALPPITKSMKAIIKTNFGEITLEFYKEDAPNTVENFVTLAKDGFYDGTKFHRVIRGFMIQGGDPLTKDESAKNRWGTGGPGYMFADEIHANNRNGTGTISMANAGPNTNGSQFFINTVDNNSLDSKHTVFGRVTAGMDVVGAIETTATEGPDRPIEDVVIERLEIVED